MGDGEATDLWVAGADSDQDALHTWNGRCLDLATGQLTVGLVCHFIERVGQAAFEQIERGNITCTGTLAEVLRGLAGDCGAAVLQSKTHRTQSGLAQREAEVVVGGLAGLVELGVQQPLHQDHRAGMAG